MQSADNDDKALEPHAGVDAHAHEINDEHVSTTPAKPEKLGRKTIAKQHPHPPVPPVRAEHAVPESEALVLIPAVPGDEEFHGVGVGDDRAGEQDDLRHFVHMLRRDDVVQFKQGARRQHQREHHGEPAEDGSGDKVRWEDGRVPGRQNGCGEVERHDAVD